MNFTQLLPAHIQEWVSSIPDEKLADIFKSLYEVCICEPSKPVLNFSLVEPKPSGLAQGNQTSNENKTSLVPALIGLQGEYKFEEICKKLPNNFRLINTAKVGHKGDFIIEYDYKGRLYRCLVDIKKYNKSVPTSEIDKFYSDLEYNNFDAGLMMSLNSRFTGITDRVYLTDATVSCSKIPVMFLSELDESLVVDCINMLMVKATIVQSTAIPADKITMGLNYINMMLDNLGTIRYNLKTLKISTQDHIDKMSDMLIQQQIKIKQTLNIMFQDLIIKGSNNENKVEIKKMEFDYPDKFNSLMIQFMSFKWISLDMKKDLVSAICTEFECHLTATKTTIRITIPINKIKTPDKMNELLLLMKKSKTHYSQVLTQDIIDELNLYF